MSLSPEGVLSNFGPAKNKSHYTTHLMFLTNSFLYNLTLKAACNECCYPKVRWNHATDLVMTACSHPRVLKV